ncbi:hypothetical protein JXL21_08995 [Candidatus Bathyarchaeota archaeon]|nr:hypothetical protein [Candidatus Bathyarchaeota archaeon]
MDSEPSEDEKPEDEAEEPDDEASETDEDKLEDKPEEALKPKKKRPVLYDYLAGAMLANGVVWIWMQALPLFIKGNDQLIFNVIAELSWVVFIFGGYISSRQVCKRAEEKHLLVGLKLAAASWVMGILIMFTLAPDPDFRLIVALLICFAAGGVLGGYMAVRANLNKRRRQAIS